METGAETEELQALFRPWEDKQGILIAVSGGPDSMALLHLTVRWAATLAHPPKLFCLTFDHALRADSVAEAKMVADVCGRLGVRHKTVRWEGEKPTTAIQERAREARYQALFEFAREVNANAVFVGHHADDQAETILFRLLRGSGLSGLAGMRPDMSPFEDMTVGRPLLSLPKQRLVQICEQAGLSFAHDPSNEDPRFARTKTRLALKALKDLGLDGPDWSRLAKRLARADDALEAGARDALEKCRRAPRPGALYALDFKSLSEHPEEVVLRCMRNILDHADPPFPLRLERLEAMVERLIAAHSRGKAFAATLAGLKFTLDRRGLLEIAPAPPRRFG